MAYRVADTWDQGEEGWGRGGKDGGHRVVMEVEPSVGTLVGQPG